jgi:NAD(P)-dependent dehydrogenase (short-subunit alcohol dehydrogenase family)
MITGSSRGLGRAVALRYAREGARVSLCSRTPKEIEAVAQEIRRAGGDAIGLKADVSQERDVDRLTAMTLKAFGRLDVLVNNAGVLTPRAPIHQVKVTDWDATLAVNLRGPFLCIRSVLPHLLKQGSGSVINVSSGAGKRRAPTWGPYAVSKFGIEGLTGAVAEETRGSGVRVNAINPGGTRTSMRASAYPEEDPTQLQTPEDIAGIFVYLASDASREVTGLSLDAPDWLKEHPEWR